jgi:hypothetical protein
MAVSARSPGVGCLLRAGCPSAIPRSIGSIVVDAIQRMLRWFRSDVIQELLETIAPLRADSNTTAAVVFIRLRVWIQAALAHRTPDCIFFAALSVDSGSVRDESLFGQFSHQAAAGFRRAISKRDRSYQRDSPTVAATEPLSQLLALIPHDSGEYPDEGPATDTLASIQGCGVGLDSAWYSRGSHRALLLVRGLGGQSRSGRANAPSARLHPTALPPGIAA